MQLRWHFQIINGHVRIVVTTRKEDVGFGSSGIRSHILHIRPLENSEAWSLFCMKAFSGYPDRTCPSELKALAKELVKKCDCLPLAVAALGGQMSSKKSMIEWSVCDNLNWQLYNNQKLEVVKNILLRSFDELPYPLKPCFLYCCLFPEDHIIRRKRLIRLWIAEGFIPQVSRITSKELAESYLMELACWSMLQVIERNQSGRPKACKMHDLLCELLSVSEREEFCTIYDGRGDIELYNAHRLSTQTTNEDLESYSGMPQLRSFLVFAAHSMYVLYTLLSKLKNLRVLDLENSTIEKLPDSLGILFNLRCLNLKRTQVAELPKSIGGLINLETLNIRDTPIKKLPIGVARLKNLRNLIMYRYNHGHVCLFQYVSGTRALFKIYRLKKLRVTSFVEAEGDTIRQLGKMTQLNRMGISNMREMDEMDFCSSILNFKRLRY
ncbi:ubiquitin ligase protein, lrsam1, putative [Ricinus communis]|uniref:Ubiquitin ligase protein, lrsam1, putative n=1 Tax=Ricinus communis TaxID=3988 RepID=B9SHR0_RICCO|nr:ubiquitin ligase protein, lrsam1, putative [Ricinus communis]